MRGNHTKLLLVAVFFLGLTSRTNAQHNSVMVGGGLSTVLGDANLELFDFESYGYSFTFRYIHPFKKNDRFNFTMEVTSSEMTQRGYIDFDLYNPNIRQVYVGMGCRFYLFNTIREYNPYFLEILPFVELGAGLLNHYFNYEKPFANTLGFIESPEGGTQRLTIQGTGGILLVLSKHWGLEGFVGLRYDPSDKWDGLKGSSGIGDIFGHGGLGVNYAF